MKFRLLAAFSALLSCSVLVLSLSAADRDKEKAKKSGEISAPSVKMPEKEKGKLKTDARTFEAASGYVYINANGGFLLADKSRGIFELNGNFYAANDFQYLGSDGTYWHEQMVGWNAEFAFQITSTTGTYAIWWRLTPNGTWLQLPDGTRGVANGDHN